MLFLAIILPKHSQGLYLILIGVQVFSHASLLYCYNLFFIISKCSKLQYFLITNYLKKQYISIPTTQFYSYTEAVQQFLVLLSYHSISVLSFFFILIKNYIDHLPVYKLILGFLRFLTTYISFCTNIYQHFLPILNFIPTFSNIFYIHG